MGFSLLRRLCMPQVVAIRACQCMRRLQAVMDEDEQLEDGLSMTNGE